MRKKGNLLKRFLLIILLLLFILSISVGFKINKQVKQVKSFEPVIKEATKKYDIEDYSDIVLAIIYTESKGNHVDLMQSSESRYGERNQIMTSDESIDSGVEHLSEVIKESENQQCDIWTAVQAYNFGTNYIDYVAERDKKNSLDLAEAYSKEILAPLLGNTTGETYTYNHPFALIRNGGKLYKNGGNFFYAESVRWNLRLIHLFSNS